MPCPEWYDLVDQYRSAVHAYGDAVDRFRNESKWDVQGSWRNAEHARSAADRARGALLFHERNHNCLAARAAAVHTRVSFEAEELCMEEMALGDQGQSGG